MYATMIGTLIISLFYTKMGFINQLRLGYVDRLIVDYDGFINSIQFDTQESIRALEVIKRGLAEMEGISWERS